MGIPPYNNLKGSPFVFLNGCNIFTNESGTHISLRDASLVINNIAGAFICAGARAVLTPRTKIYDNHARDIAVDYYKLIMQGETFGEALRRIRENRYLENRTSFNWLTYMLLGDPSTRLSLKRDLFSCSENSEIRVIEQGNFSSEVFELLKISSQYLNEDHKLISADLFFIAFIDSPMFSRMIPVFDRSHSWRIAKSIRDKILGQDAQRKPAPQEIAARNFSNDAIDILDKALQKANENDHSVIEINDFCEALFRNENSELDKKLGEIGAEYNIREISSLSIFLNSIKGYSLFDLRGQLSISLVEEKTKTIFFAIESISHRNSTQVDPWSLFCVCVFLPGTKTNIFITNTKEYDAFLRRAISLPDRYTQHPDVTEEMAVNANSLTQATETILLDAFSISVMEERKLSEKHIIRSLLQSEKGFGPQVIGDQTDQNLDAHKGIPCLCS